MNRNEDPAPLWISQENPVTETHIMESKQQLNKAVDENVTSTFSASQNWVVPLENRVAT